MIKDLSSIDSQSYFSSARHAAAASLSSVFSNPYSTLIFSGTVVITIKIALSFFKKESFITVSDILIFTVSWACYRCQASKEPAQVKVKLVQAYTKKEQLEEERKIKDLEQQIKTFQEILKKASDKFANEPSLAEESDGISSTGELLPSNIDHMIAEKKELSEQILRLKDSLQRQLTLQQENTKILDKKDGEFAKKELEKERKIKDLEQQVKTLQEILKKASDKFANETPSLAEELGSSSFDGEFLVSNINHLFAENIVMREQILHLQDSLQQQLALQQENTKTLDQKNNEFKQKLQESEYKIKDLEEEKTALQSIIFSNQEEITKLKKNISKLKSTLIAYEGRENKNLEEQVQKLEERIQQLLKKNQRHEEKAEAIGSIIAEQNCNLLLNVHSIKELEKKRKLLSLQIIALEERISQLEGENKILLACREAEAKRAVREVIEKEKAQKEVEELKKILSTHERELRNSPIKAA